MSGIDDPIPLSAARPFDMGTWWLRNRWDNLAFVHWAYEPETVQALLPDGIRVDTHDGKAWVSLVPFEMRDAMPRWLPALPWISSFAETNVRTYVVDSAGQPSGVVLQPRGDPAADRGVRSLAAGVPLRVGAR